MTNKNKVIAITFPDPLTVAKIRQFQATKGVKTETEAARMIIERYFTLSIRQREALEKKVSWKQHRNKGFRSLARFVEGCPKRKTKTHVLPSTQSTSETTQGSI